MQILSNLLIAPPALKSNFWHKTVVMVTENHAHGSVGLVLNKPSNTTIRDFGDQLDITLNVPGFVYIGGPVNNKSLSLLHSADWESKNTLHINDMFSLSSADDILPRLAVGDTPRYWRLFMGMCGWAPGQLVSEINGSHPYKPENSWCVTTANLDLVFEYDSKDQWCKALDQSAQEFAQNLLS